MHNDIPRELSFCNQRTSAARGTEMQNFQPSSPQPGREEPIALLIVCHTVEKPPTAPNQHQQNLVISYNTNSCLGLHMYTKYTTA